MSCRSVLGLPDRRPTFRVPLETELGITCADPRGGGWFGRMTEQSPLTGYEDASFTRFKVYEIQSQRQEVYCAYLDHTRLFSLLGCARSKPQICHSSVESEIFSRDPGLPSGWITSSPTLGVRLGNIIQ